MFNEYNELTLIRLPNFKDFWFAI